MDICINQVYRINTDLIKMNLDLQFKKVFKDIQEIRIVFIQNGIVYFIDLGKTMSVPINISIDDFEMMVKEQLIIRSIDSFVIRGDMKSIPEDRLKKCEEHYSIVEKIINDQEEKIKLYQKRYRNKLFRQISTEYNLTFSMVKRIFYRFWQRGMVPLALLDSYERCGDPGVERIDQNRKKAGRKRKANFSVCVNNGVAVTVKDRKNFKEAIKEYYFSGVKKTLKDTYEIMREKYFRNIYNSQGKIIGVELLSDEEMPSYRQFVYWFHKDRDIKKETKSREGEKNYNKDLRPLNGKARDGIVGPGSRYEIDATIADLYLISPISGEVFGRPVIYTVFDVYSDEITAIHVGVNEPSWREAALCLLNMIEDKVEYCKKFGIDIPRYSWPAHHLPSVLFTDRGEFVSDKSRNFTLITGVEIKHAPPSRPDYKGFVEQGFTIFNGITKRFLPGAVQKPINSRGVKRPELDAALTLTQFTKLIIAMVLKHNSSGVRRLEGAKEVYKVPNEEWNEGIKLSSGSLKEVNNLDAYKLSLMETGKASISRMGLTFDGYLYALNNPTIYLQNANKDVTVAYDRRNMSQIYIPDKSFKKFETCFLNISKYMGLSYDEVAFEFDIINTNNRILKKKESDNSAALVHFIQTEVENAIIEKNKFVSPTTKSKVFSGKSRNKSLMRDVTSKEDNLLIESKDNSETINLPDITNINQMIRQKERERLKSAKLNED